MLLPKRVWKDIPGFEGKYQVSNTGQVRTLNYKRTGQTKILKQGIGTHGYKIINLYKNHSSKTYTVHRLVAQAFIPNPNNYPVVNHKDENKHNNAVWNLEWASYSYNINYGTARDRRAKTRGKEWGQRKSLQQLILEATEHIHKEQD